MTLPTQTWRVSAKYPVTVAGATATAQEIITAVKQMFDAEDAIGNNYWTYAASSYVNNGTTGTMIIKRKGTPSGTLATFRALLAYTSGTPNAAGNAAFDVTLAGNTVYIGTSENHNSDSLLSAFTAGACLTGKYSKMNVRFAASNAALEATDAPKIFMVECDEICSIWIVSSTSGFGGAHVTFGAIAERMDLAEAIWGFIGHDTTMTAAQTGIETTAACLIPILAYTTAGVTAGCYYDNAASVARVWGRLGNMFHTAGMEDCTRNYDNSIAINLPILMGSKLAAGNTQPQFCAGVLRQIRFGPRIIGQQIVRDGLNVVKGYAVAPGHTTNSRGIFFDNSP